jgi:hypothetical protein
MLTVNILPWPETVRNLTAMVTHQQSQQGQEVWKGILRVSPEHRFGVPRAGRAEPPYQKTKPHAQC